ncbi:AfsR/SARP family transcriptional regulator [Lentzea xinjiangensis]|uniref:AfsR/SARP family transcriptional regulator n=1 Tax=Lentzea xinjiangensis TaxID=402600 RepID=UPI001FE84D9B|nr:BTAD domain-containing putative transcriptional regulator [Lentzea xinjiangensis]
MRAWRDDAELDLGSPQQKLALAVLLLADGRVVPVTEMIAAMWGEDAPPAARGTVRTYVYRLRRVLGRDESGEPVPTSAGNGYRVRLAAGRVDLGRFLGAVRAADTAADPERRAELLRTALAEWRDRPLAGVEGAWARRERRRVVRLWVQAAESWAELELGRGGHAGVVERLRVVVEAEPLRERSHELLMRALHQSGRPAEALAVYERIRVTLQDELGVDPGPALREWHRRVVGAGPAPPPGAAAGPVRPTPLPAPLAVFTGRERELRELDARLDEGSAQPAIVVHGTAGVGKTTFVVQWANRIAPRFPDGQLYVNLRGFDAEGAVREPADVLRELLDGLGVAKAGRPDGVDGLVALYRGVLAGRRVLVVLDNARDSGQVLPLLPGSPRCLVVVTSRSALTGLVASTGAHMMGMRLLDMPESVALLARRLGERRVAAESAAVRSIAATCAHLPLALAVASARIATNPALSLSEFSRELAEHAELGLDFLTGDDPRSDVRSVLSWSYRALNREAARLFRLLAVLPLSQTGTAAVASVAGLPPPRAQVLLRELVAVGLLVEDRPGRFSWHDLLRDYSAELLAGTGDADERQAARRRLLDHYLVVTRSATVALSSARDVPELPELAPGVSPRPVSGGRAALEVLTSEHDTLVALVDLAAESGFEAHCWRIAWHLRFYLDWKSLWSSMTRINEVALRAAERIGDDVGAGHARRGLARAAFRTGRPELAVRHLDAAVEALRSGRDRRAQAYAHLQASANLSALDRVELALAHAEQASAIFREVGPRAAQGTVLMHVAFAKMRSGEYREAIGLIGEISGFEDDSAPVAELVFRLDMLSDAHDRLGEHGKSVEVHEREIRILREMEIFDDHHAAFLDEKISLAMFTLARSLFLAGRPDRAVPVQREAFARLRSFLAAPKAGSDFWASEGGRVDRLLGSIDLVLADDRPDAVWFVESVRVFDSIATALVDGAGVVTDMVNVRDRNRAVWPETHPGVA